ncbi:MAG TPA: PASTA domain-containing protein [Solirubrobacteraceae bacterium]|nr:PASTA domain-containing protein [Solirubrobacteraceae bacterium]
MPVAASFADDPFDGEIGLAPEVASVDVSLGAVCELAVIPRLADRSETAGLIRDETVTTYIDTDGNPATGAPQWGGADRAVLVVGQNGPDLPPVLGTWTGGEFSFSAAPILPAVGAAGFTTTVDQLAVPGSTMLGIRVASSWSGLRDIYDDFAPEPGTPSYAFAVTFAAVPVAPPPAAAPPAPPAPATTAQSRQACTVPNVRRLVATSARRKLSRVGCRSRVVRVRSRVKAGRVVSTSPTAGTRTRRTVVVRVSTGST